MPMANNLALRYKSPEKEDSYMAKKKNPAAVKLGRKGGLARAKNLSKEQLSKIGKKGGRPRKKPVDKT